jgi:hypothetical protein
MFPWVIHYPDHNLVISTIGISLPMSMKKLLLTLFSISIPFCLFAQNQFILDTGSDLSRLSHNSVYFEWIDVDNDGDLDLFITNMDGGSSLYINQGAGHYELLVDDVISKESGHKGKWADYDNDGFLDLYMIVNPGRNKLFRNKGNGTFEKIEDVVPLVTDNTNSRDFDWVDYDNDGDMDIYVGNENSTNNKNCLYNNIDGRFNRVYTGIIVEDPGDIKMCFWLDINNNGLLDLFLANHTGSVAYINQGQSGLFSRLEPNPYQNIRPTGAVGWTDYNGDGLPDMLLAENSPKLLITQPDLTINEINLSFDVPGTLLAKSISWGDFDNDGDMDLLILADNIYLFRNDGDYILQG